MTLTLDKSSNEIRSSKDELRLQIASWRTVQVWPTHFDSDRARFIPSNQLITTKYNVCVHITAKFTYPFKSILMNVNHLVPDN